MTYAETAKTDALLDRAADGPSPISTNEDFATTAANTVVSSLGAAEQPMALAEVWFKSAVITISNQTKRCLTYHSHYAAHGKFADGMGALPDIAPQFTFTTHKKDKNGNDLPLETIVFDDAVEVSSNKGSHVAPTCVMMWDVSDVDVMLLVAIDMHSSSNHKGYFALLEKAANDLFTAEQWHSANSGSLVDHGSLKKLCSMSYPLPDGGAIAVSGTLDNASKGAKMTISLSETA